MAHIKCGNSRLISIDTYCDRVYYNILYNVFTRTIWRKIITELSYLNYKMRWNMIYKAIDRLVFYGIEKKLLEESDIDYVRNKLLYTLNLPSYEIEHKEENKAENREDNNLSDILNDILEYAIKENLIDDSITEKDLFDTKIMDCLLGRPSEIIKKFETLYENPKNATDWYYDFSKATNYIRTDRIARDIKWKSPSPYGELDITINLSKPEKDPKAIAAAKSAKTTSYPKCALCRENEGFAGDIKRAARENHRLIPLELSGESYFLQYSPYVYYNEHCIVLNKKHIPMKIDKSTFTKLLEFTNKFPHYFIGSNADLPIVGGSILTHDHFQGGSYEFPMAKSGLKFTLKFKEYEDIEAGIVKWPMPTIRLKSSDYIKLSNLSDKILRTWRKYSDKSLDIISETNGEPHNTITPIARRRGNEFEIDLVLRNNRITEEFPLGIFHPHSELHHIKKENIGLIEVMGLAVLPGRLKAEMDLLKEIMLSSNFLESIEKNEILKKHEPWAKEILEKHSDFNKTNADKIIRDEIAIIFLRVLEDAGVYKDNEAGNKGIVRFIESVNCED